MKELKIAAIDIGSNAIRLLIEEARSGTEGDNFDKISLVRVPLRLGTDVFTQGRISDFTLEQLTKAMKAFGYLIELHHVVAFRACATSALRDALNRAEVIQHLQHHSGIKIEILSGDEEANVIFGNFFAQKLNKYENCLFIDVGGGSTELTLIKKGNRIKSRSFQLGTVRLLTATAPLKEWDLAHDWIQKELDTNRLIAIGTGGNINSLFKLLGRKSDDKISLKNIRNQYSILKSMTYEQRITRLKLKSDRADVIIPACEIYMQMMEWAGIEEMVVPKIGLADGLIIQQFNDLKSKSREEISSTALSR